MLHGSCCGTCRRFHLDERSRNESFECLHQFFGLRIDVGGHPTHQVILVRQLEQLWSHRPLVQQVQRTEKSLVQGNDRRMVVGQEIGMDVQQGMRQRALIVGNLSFYRPIIPVIKAEAYRIVHTDTFRQFGKCDRKHFFPPQLPGEETLHVLSHTAQFRHISFLEIALGCKRRLVRQKHQQGIGPVGQLGEVDAAECRDFRSCIFSRQGRHEVFQGGHFHLLPHVVHFNAPFLQFFQKVEPVHLEHNERIVVNLPAEHIDHGCQMFARHRPIGTTAIHLQVIPSFGEYLQAAGAGDVQHLRVQFPVEETGDDARSGYQPVHQLVHLSGGKLRDGDFNAVRPRTAALHLGADNIILQLYFTDGAIAGISCAAGDAVLIINVGQRTQPFVAPPCIAKLLCHI